MDDALSRELKIASRVDIRYSLNEALLTFSCERATPACMRQVAAMFGVAYIFWTEIQGTGPYEINVQGVHGKRTDENYSLQYTFNSKTAALRAVRPFVAALIAGIPYEGRNAPGVEELARPQADEDARLDSAIPVEQTREQTASTQRKWPLRLAIASGVVGLVSLGVGSYYGLQDNDAIAEMESVKNLHEDGKISASEYKIDFGRQRANRDNAPANINFMGIAPIAGILMGYGLYEHFRRDQPQVP